MKKRIGFVSNSSSEAFLCDTGDSLNRIREDLVQMVEFHNAMFDNKVSFENAFQEPRIFSRTDRENLECWGYPFDSQSPEIFTKVLIISKKDNSIPYDLFDVIERKYNAVRSHLG